MSDIENEILTDPDKGHRTVLVRDGDSDILVSDLHGELTVMSSGPITMCGECERPHMSVELNDEAALALARAAAPNGYAVIPLDDVIYGKDSNSISYLFPKAGEQ